MPESRGEIVGRSAAERLVLLSGALAEAGVGELVLKDGAGKCVALQARDTDLPGVLGRCGAGATLAGKDGDLAIRLTANACEWVTAEPAVAASLQRASGRETPHGS